VHASNGRLRSLRSAQTTVYAVHRFREATFSEAADDGPVRRGHESRRISGLSHVVIGPRLSMAVASGATVTSAVNADRLSGLLEAGHAPCQAMETDDSNLGHPVPGDDSSVYPRSV